MTQDMPLISLDRTARPAIADLVYGELHKQVLNLDLKPGEKLSEAEIAKRFEVSRQPVRDAFYRLSKMGFLLIRPQRATLVSLISTRAVMQAQFIRIALEAEAVRHAATRLTAADIQALEGLIAEQAAAKDAGDKLRFHAADDAFHREICLRAGLEFTWDLIAENKGHMDRVRMLSLAFSSQTAWDDHIALTRALADRDPDGAAEIMRAHLSRIHEQLIRIRAEHEAYFEDDDPSEASLPLGLREKRMP
ncbi:GntR family transcriptional regulator [Roseovarius sp. 10]|jgi:DNA-binding GntR family transcriptional regulator|uniref:GntR family transcriptional regulator n=1 Tax=Roseovarius sp. 10 TaxID=3080563 RepID=UPI002954D2F8|nr:GntR family transcriptional regulator [Roseovarius sp. 10]MDV7201335.1 GntR family transcriptional regulator [Roseovarius sp. 10]